METVVNLGAAAAAAATKVQQSYMSSSNECTYWCKKEMLRLTYTPFFSVTSQFVRFLYIITWFLVVI